MDPNVTPLERAFQLAKTGQFLDVAGIKLRLKQEGYAQDQIQGRSLYRQLQGIIRGALSLDSKDSA
jgi:hypothetical protein